MIDTTADLRQELHAMTESLNEVKARNADLERKLAWASRASTPMVLVHGPVRRDVNPAANWSCQNCSLVNFGYYNFCVRCSMSQRRSEHVAVPAPASRSNETGAFSTFSSSSTRPTIVASEVNFRGGKRSRKRNLGASRYGGRGRL